MPRGHWEDVTPDQLQGMLKEGLSYQQIASKFDVTRNIVSGQVYRWRKAGHMGPAAPHRAATQPHRTRAAKNQPFTLSGKTLQAPPPPNYRPPPPSQPRTIRKPTNEPIPLMRLETGMCAYVVQERPYLFCGCTPTVNKKFRLCAYHAQGFFSKERDRNRVR